MSKTSRKLPEKMPLLTLTVHSAFGVGAFCKLLPPTISRLSDRACGVTSDIANLKSLR